MILFHKNLFNGHRIEKRSRLHQPFYLHLFRLILAQTWHKKKELQFLHRNSLILSGPRWARTIDPLIMSPLFSIYHPLRISQAICVIFNINKDLCVYTNKINCSFYVKYSTGLHGFAKILAKKLAPSFSLE